MPTNSNNRGLPAVRGKKHQRARTIRGSGRRPQPPPKQSFYRSFAFVTPPAGASANQNQLDRHIQYIDWPNPPRLSTPVSTSRQGRGGDTFSLGNTMSVHPAAEDVDNRFGIGIDISSTSAVDLLMDDWLDRFEQEQWDFNSMAVYGEVKLLEAMKMTEQLEQPNDFVTALCCNLLSKLVPAFGPYVELMELLEEEIVRSIYYDYEKHTDRSNTRQLFAGITYDKKAKQYQQDIADLTKQRTAFESTHAEVVKDIKAKSFQVAQSVKQWHNQSLIASFRAWHAYVVFKKNNLAKTQKIFQRWVMSSSDLLRKVFHGWKIFRQKHQQENISRVEDLSREKFNEIQKTLVNLREKVSSGKSELDRTTRQLADLKVELGSKSADLTDAQNRLAGSVDREAAVLSQASVWAELARGMMQSSIDEFQENYNHAEAYKESFPTFESVLGDKNAGGINQFVNFWMTADGSSEKDTISSVRHDMTPAVYDKLLKSVNKGVEGVENKIAGKESSSSRRASVVLRDSDEQKEAQLLVDYSARLLERFKVVREMVHGGPPSSPQAAEVVDSILMTEENAGDAAALGDVPILTAAAITEPNEATTLCFLAQLMTQSNNLCIDPWQPLPNADSSADEEESSSSGKKSKKKNSKMQVDNATIDALQVSWDVLNASVRETPLETSSAAGADKPKRKPLKNKKGAKSTQVDRITDVPQEKVQEINTMLTSVRETLNVPIQFAETRCETRKTNLNINTMQCWEAAAAFANNKKEDVDGVALEEEPPANPAVLKYGTIDRKRIAELLEGEEKPEEEWKSLCLILVKRTALVKTAYVSCAAGGNATMDLKEFWKIVKQCKMPDKALTLAEIDLIFQKVNVEDQSTAGDSNDANPDGELLPTEFLEALIRIAAEKYKGVCKTLSACVDALMMKNLKPNVSELNTSAFRKDLAQPQFKAIITANKACIAGMFKKYTASDRSTGSSATMSLREWLAFIKDFKLSDARFSARDATCVFANSQDDGAGEDPGDQQEMVYSEFIEALTACACYKVPDPFLTLELRMGQFLADSIVPVYREKKRNSEM